MVCFDCGNAGDMHQHHVIPKSVGGNETIPLCMECHGKVHERSFTNHRELTIKGLAAAKARGVKLGNVSNLTNRDTTKATAAKRDKSMANNVKMQVIMADIEAEHGSQSLRGMAALLNNAGYTTSQGKYWQATSVRRVLL